MSRRHLALVGVGAVLAAGLPLLAAPAQALGAPVAFSASKQSTWQTNGVVHAIATSQGKVFVGGDFTRIRPPGQPDTVTTTVTDEDGNTTTTTSPNPQSRERVHLAVFDAATGAPSDCRVDVTGSLATVRALDVSPDGRLLYVGGLFNAVGGSPRTNLAAIDIASCTVDDTWQPLASGFVRALKATPSTVYAGGGFGIVSTKPHLRVAAINALTGAVLPGFTASFQGTTHDGIAPDVNALALKPDGSALVVAGNFDQVNGSDSHALAVVDPTTGATIKAFPGFITAYQSEFNDGSSVKALAVDASGFYTGNEGTGKFVFDGRIAVNWDYTERWRDGCLGATQGLAVHKDVLYIAAHAHDCSDLKEFGDGGRHHLLAETTGSTTPTSHAKPTLLGWTPDTDDGLAEGIGPRAIVVASSGGVDYLWTGGDFTSVNSASQQGLTRFVAGITVGPTVPALSATSFVAGKVQLAVRASTDNDDSALTYKLYRDGAQVLDPKSATSLPWSRPQVTWTDTQPAGSTHTYRVTVSDGVNVVTSLTISATVAKSTSAFATSVVGDGPLLLLRYDEPAGLFLSDSSGKGNSLKLNSTAGQVFKDPGLVTGDASRSLRFAGASSAYAVTEKRFDAPTSFTLETWFKTSAAGGQLIGFSDSQSLPSQTYDSRNPVVHLPDKVLYMTAGGQLVFGTESTPGSKKTLTSAAGLAYNHGIKHYVVATQDATGMTLYLDGKSVAHNTITTNGAGNGYWRVGGDALTGWPSAPSSHPYFGGSLDETAVYTRALTQAEITEHYTLSR